MSSKSDPIRFQPIHLKVVGRFKLNGQRGSVISLEVEGVEGLDTGLAFHLTVDSTDFTDNTTPTESRPSPTSQQLAELTIPSEGEGDGVGYILTHIRSGKSLGHKTVETPRQAQMWLSLVTALASPDWTQPDLGPYLANRATAQTLSNQVEQSRRQAIEHSFYSTQ